MNLMDGRGEATVRPVEHTLRWVVVTFRLLAALWSLALILAVVLGGSPGDRPVMAGTASLAAGWAVFTLVGARRGFLGHIPFALADGLVISVLSAAGLVAGTEDFISGGYPGSWLFVVAFVANLRWTLAAGVFLVLEHTVIHLLMGLGPVRTTGTFQFLVFALIAGWAFDSVRERERLRLVAEERLASEQRIAVRLEEGTRLARKLHDSVLQTLKAIQSEAENPEQVRYLARWQERGLRSTIEDLRSEYEGGFRARLLAVRDEVDDLYQTVTTKAVIRNDAEITPNLEVALDATHEALTNAAKHSGADLVDLYAEISDGWVTVNVRDRGHGFDPSATGRGSSMSMVDPVETIGGVVEVVSKRGTGTEVTIRVPVQ